MARPSWAHGTIAALLLAASVGVSLPACAPGYGDARSIVAHGTGLAAGVTALPCFWRLGRRFRKRPKLARIAAVVLWLGLVSLLEAFVLLATMEPFMSQREVCATIRSRDGRVTYDVYRDMNWNDPGDPEITMRLGPFETVVARGHHEDPEDLMLRGVDVVAHGHRLEIHRGGLADLYANQAGGALAFVDGQAAFLDWR
jgi:hypothetical protein